MHGLCKGSMLWFVTVLKQQNYFEDMLLDQSSVIHSQVAIEDYLDGYEQSLLCFCVQ